MILFDKIFLVLTIRYVAASDPVDECGTLQYITFGDWYDNIIIILNFTQQ